MKIIFNYKANIINLNRAKRLATNLVKNGKDSGFDIVACPSDIYLTAFKHKMSKHNNLNVGAQEVSTENMGAFTSQTPAQILANCGVNHAIISHSETKGYLVNELSLIKERVTQCTKYGITPVVCIDDDEMDWINQIVEHCSLKELVIAYEPKANIGTGEALSKEELSKAIMKIYKLADCDNLTILYGGSVNSANLEELASIDKVEGFLIGTASNNIIETNKILSLCQQITTRT